MSSYRGNWRPVRGPRGFGSSSFRGDWHGTQASSRAPSPPSPPVGPLLAIFDEDDLKDHPYVSKGDDDDKITDFEDVASYNWMDEKEASIVVPGSPPAWTPLRTATRLKPDSGDFLRDQNAARSPAYPMEPAARSIFTCQPKFQGPSVDLVACSSTVGNLFRYVDGQFKTFRILVETVGDTVFFVRRENSPTQLIPGITGFGHSFPEAYTTWGAEVRRSESHQRIVKYKFGGLDLVVRFEADGYLKELVPTVQSGATAPSTNEADLDESFSSALQVGTKKPQSCGNLTVGHGGQQIPRSAIFDLKTRSFRKKDQDTLAEELPRLWLTQIPNFILAYHQGGLFDDIRVQEVGKEIDGWERDNRDTLRRFGSLLRKIVAFARDKAGITIELRRQDLGLLELREQSKGTDMGALPDELKERWICGSFGGSEQSFDDRDDSEAPDLYHSSGGGIIQTDDEDSEEDLTAYNRRFGRGRY
ncbi:MAG: hypothetical protein Q9170_003473 [Blastenia crenularia]